MTLVSFSVPYSAHENQATLAGVLQALGDAMATRDGSTHLHAERVQHYALSLARHLRITDAAVLQALDQASLLHDIGKLGIPDRLLHKPGPLTRDEFDLVKDHVTIGADMLRAVAVPAALTLIVRHHHENWDGSGYPDGLAGEQLPVGARLLV